jgi:hypothetical protein
MPIEVSFDANLTPEGAAWIRKMATPKRIMTMRFPDGDVRTFEIELGEMVMDGDVAKFDLRVVKEIVEE